jgi:nucleoside-diphosphate-sugar epimerase
VSAVTVTGASSQLGVFLLPRLLADGHEVRAVSRRSSPGGFSGVKDLRWLTPAEIDAAPPGRLVSCGPIGLARDLVSSGRVTGKAVVFSTSSIRTKLDSAERAERSKVERIAEAEAQLETLCEERDIALALIRPTLVYGCGLDANLTRMLSLGEKLGLIPVSNRSGGLRQPVHADDLAELANRILKADFGPYAAGEACGGSTLSYRAMIETVAACGSRPIRVLALPLPILAGLVRVAAAIGPWDGINPGMAHRQAIDMVFDDSEFRRRFDWTPRLFAPTADDFRIPPELQKFLAPNVGAT